MKKINAIKKLVKAGFEVSKASHLYEAKKDGNPYVIEFMPNGRDVDDASIVCIRTKRVNEKDDIMTDYFVGTWHKNLTQAIKFIS